MSSKLREDLPYRGQKWSREAIDIFNQNRDEYKKAAKTAKSFYGERAFIADGESANHDGVTKMLVMMAEQGAKIAQLLMKHETGVNNMFRLSRAYDVVTAFYVPEDIQWLKVDANGYKIGEFHGKYHELELDEILKQSKQLPASEDKSHLEYILWVSRQGKIGFVHNQEESIEIDGVRYNRLIFMQPMLPIVQCVYTDMIITTSGPCTVYLEVSTADSEIRNKLSREPMTAWVEDVDDGIPVVRYSGGVVEKPYMSNRRKDDTALPSIDLPQFSLGSVSLEGPSLDTASANVSII